MARALLNWSDLWVRLYDDTDLHMGVLTPTGVTLALDVGTILSCRVPKPDQYVIKSGDESTKYAEIILVGSTVKVAYHPGTRLTLVQVFDGHAKVRNLTGEVQKEELVSAGGWALVKPDTPPEVSFRLEGMRALARQLGLWDVFHEVEVDVAAGFGPSDSQVASQDAAIVFVEAAGSSDKSQDAKGRSTHSAMSVTHLLG